MHYTKLRKPLPKLKEKVERSMDFSQRGISQHQPVQQSTSPAPGADQKKKRGRGFAWLRFSSVILLFSATILIAALAVFLAIGGPASESKYLDKNRLQAVFLNNGQVYFGKITNLNERYVRIADIYYLRQSQNVQTESSSDNNSDFSLVKLGCEVHAPSDEMVVNREQVIFWENLKDDGQVAKAVREFKKQNPNGQKCEQPAN